MQENNKNNNQELKEIIVDSVDDLMKNYIYDNCTINQKESYQEGTDEKTFKNQHGFLRTSKIISPNSYQNNTNAIAIDKSQKLLTGSDNDSDIYTNEDDCNEHFLRNGINGRVGRSYASKSSSTLINQVLSPDFEQFVNCDIVKSKSQHRFHIDSNSNSLEIDTGTSFNASYSSSVDIDDYDIDDEGNMSQTKHVDKKEMFWLWEDPTEFLQRQSQITTSVTTTKGAQTNQMNSNPSVLVPQTSDSNRKSQAFHTSSIKMKYHNLPVLPVPLVSNVLNLPATLAAINGRYEDDVSDDYASVNSDSNSVDTFNTDEISVDDSNNNGDDYQNMIHTSGGSVGESPRSDGTADDYLGKSRPHDSSLSGDLSDILSPLELRLLRSSNSNR